VRARNSGPPRRPSRGQYSTSSRAAARATPRVVRCTKGR
jgi:hypothetical protein